MTIRRFGDQRGFTLVELLVSMTLSLIVVSAAFSLVSASERSSKRVRDRVDASQRGRVALEQITQELRAMACVPPTGATTYTSPIVSATNDQIVFQTNIIDPAKLDPSKLATAGTNNQTAQAAAFAADQRRLTVLRDGAAQVTGIREDRDFNATTGLYARSRVIITNITQARAGAIDPVKPVFQYIPYTADPSASPAPLPASTPLSATDRLNVAQVLVSFRARPSEASRDALSTVDLQSSVYARTFDTATAGSSSQPVQGAPPTFERTFRCQ